MENHNTNWISPPGTTINRILKTNAIDISSFAKKLKKTEQFVKDLICGSIQIDDDLAYALSIQLGMTKDFWKSRSHIYQEKKEILETQEWCKRFPVSEMKKKGLLNVAAKDVYSSLLEFFGIAGFSDFHNHYNSLIKQVAYKKNDSFAHDEYSVIVWIREAQLKADKMNVGCWDRNAVDHSFFEKTKKLTREKDPEKFLPRLWSHCAECGIKLIINKAMSGNRAIGATIMHQNHPLIIMSFRHLTDDHFWFAFFHEIGHVVMHDLTKLRIDESIISENETEEEEANIFAKEVLTPLTEFRQNDIPTRLNRRYIITTAASLNISAGILIGQLQKAGRVSYKYLNTYKRSYNWDQINTGIKKIETII